MNGTIYFSEEIEKKRVSVKKVIKFVYDENISNQTQNNPCNVRPISLKTRISVIQCLYKRNEFLKRGHFCT